MSTFVIGLLCEGCGEKIEYGHDYMTITRQPSGTKHIFHAEHAPKEKPTGPRHFGLQAQAGGPPPESN